MVREDQRGANINVQLNQFLLQFVIEQLTRQKNPGVVHQQADFQIVGGPLNKWQEIVPRQINRDDPGFDAVLCGKFRPDLLQPVFTSGHQYHIQPQRCEAAGECLTDPGRRPCHNGPWAEACDKIIHSMLQLVLNRSGREALSESHQQTRRTLDANPPPHERP